MATCKYCADVATLDGICNRCHQRLGLVAGSGTRRAAPCTRCNHPELVRALVRELTTEPGQGGRRESVAMAVTYEPQVNESVWTGASKGVESLWPTARYGLLDMYVCLRCGFTEWYCRDPQNIPIGAEYGTELVTSESDGPYR